jgi:hypothetical protein
MLSGEIAMNCGGAQTGIIDAIASRESELRGELHQHVRECAGCRAFLANQASLASTMDFHLRFIANQPAPPSLLPHVRARLEQKAAPRREIFRWQSVLLAIASVLLIAIGVRILRPHTTTPAPEAAAQVAPESPIVNRPVSPRVREPAPKISRVAAVALKANVPAHFSDTEVLVLPEEQQAFQRFVSHISQDQDSAKALVAAASSRADAPVEIALLAITNVEVKPLEGTDSE